MKTFDEWLVEVHHELKSSGLADMLKISPVTSNHELGKWLGKTVRYKKELIKDKDFIRLNGTIIKDNTFKIKQVQKDHIGKDMLRGYAIENNDTFGRVIDPNDIEEV